MPYKVIYDACVLYPASLRDFLLRIARTGIVRAFWSEQILAECFRAILRSRPDLSREDLARTERIIRDEFPHSLVFGYEDLVAGLALPDSDDRHVLAAAIRSGAQGIVTFNLKDFPVSTLEKFGIEPRHPDDFVLDQIELAPGLVVGALRKQVDSLRRPPKTTGQVLDSLRDCGLVQSVARLRCLLLL